MKKPTMLPAVALHQHTLLTVTGRRPGGSTKQEINSDVWYAKHVPRATLGPPSFYSASALSRDFEGVVHASFMALCVGVLFPPGHWKVSRLLSGQSCYSTMGKCLHVVTLSYSKRTFPRKTLPSGPKWRVQPQQCFLGCWEPTLYFQLSFQFPCFKRRNIFIPTACQVG